MVLGRKAPRMGAAGDLASGDGPEVQRRTIKESQLKRNLFSS